jgi:hypothetical protein
LHFFFFLNHMRIGAGFGAGCLLALVSCGAGPAHAAWWRAHADPFAALSPADVAAAYSDESATGLRAAAAEARASGPLSAAERAPLPLTLETGIEVRLVGFEGDGNYDLDVDIEQFHRCVSLFFFF